MPQRIDDAHTDDVIVGANLWAIRHAKGYTQDSLAKACGISFQQVQKYEKGKNRISASRLCQFSNVLDVPLMQFFRGTSGRPG